MINIGNNGGNDHGNVFGDEEIKFPVNYDLKVILDNKGNTELHQDAIEVILNKNKVNFSNWRTRLSSNDKYISFTVNINIYSHDQMTKLYDGLKTIKGIKLAL
jgi:putative lipoic acid-binding regulatory protein